MNTLISRMVLPRDIWMYSTTHHIYGLTDHTCSLRPHPVAVCTSVYFQASSRHAVMTSGSVMTETVFLISRGVMEMETVWMDLMKWIVQVGIPSVLVSPKSLEYDI